MNADAQSHVEEGNALYRRGDLEGALDRYEAAIAVDARCARAHFNLGVLKQNLGRLEEAAAHYEGALAADPRFAAALVNLGNVLRERGDRAAAAERYARALEIDPEESHALTNLAGLCLERGETGQARDLYARAAAKGVVEAEVGLAKIAVQSGEAQDAIERCERLLAEDPRRAAAHHGMGLAMTALERYEEAIAHYRQALALAPRFFEALVDWGDALMQLGRLEEAEPLFRRALEGEPRDPRALSGLGVLNARRGNAAQAHALFSRAVGAAPHFASARHNAALMALMSQDFESGWEGYELRFNFLPWRGSLTECALPEATADNLRDVRRLAVQKEQGIGDMVLFSTLLPEIESLGIESVVELDARLLEPYRRSLPGMRFIHGAGTTEAFATCDHRIPLGSLPRIFRRSAADFARQPRALLAADDARVHEMRARLPNGVKVGISWRSFRKGVVGDTKSFPLECLAIFGGTNATLVDLQYGDVEDERRAFDARHPGLRSQVPGLDVFADLDGLIAAIDACDLIVTGSNVTAHLAGVVGKPTWLVYLSGIAPFHYWAPGPNGRSLWYPSVEILTDRSWTTWEQAFEAIAARWRTLSPTLCEASGTQ